MPFAHGAARLGCNLAGLPMLLGKLRRKADLIYERHALLDSAGALAARGKKAPPILEVNAPPAREQHAEGDLRSLRLAAWAERAVCNMADRGLVVSTPLKRILEAHGVDGGQLERMPNGVEEPLLQDHAPPQHLRTRLGLDAEAVAGFAG